MYEIVTTVDFDNWLDGIKDGKTKKAIAKRIDTMSLGSLGETRALGDGVHEAKIRYGRGFRLYFVNKGKTIIVLLCGGDKSTQSRDIEKAKELAKGL
jgi:putative addiction module killer protein